MVRLENTSHFDLRTIMNSGQCFRIYEIMPNIFDVISMNNWVRLHYNAQDNVYNFCCTAEEFYQYWYGYFDLDTNYESYFNIINSSTDQFLKAAAEYGNGMRILRQNYWEALISFIISQNNNIPRIKKIIEALCKKFGHPIVQYHQIYYSFPSQGDMANVNLQDLKDLGLGYRAQYIYNISKCNAALLNPNNLLNIHGVGPKVKACIELFGLHKMDSYPIDTWIKKMINDIYGGHFDTTPYRGFEGFVQQLQFYYYRSLKNKNN